MSIYLLSFKFLQPETSPLSLVTLAHKTFVCGSIRCLYPTLPSPSRRPYICHFNDFDGHNMNQPSRITKFNSYAQQTGGTAYDSVLAEFSSRSLSKTCFLTFAATDAPNFCKEVLDETFYSAPALTSVVQIAIGYNLGYMCITNNGLSFSQRSNQGHKA